VLDFLFADDPDSATHGLPVAWLFASCAACREIVAEEVAAWISAMVADPARRLDGLRLACCLDVPLPALCREHGSGVDHGNLLSAFWRDQTTRSLRAHARAIVDSAAEHAGFRTVALAHNLISMGQALDMPGGLLPLLDWQLMRIFDTRGIPYLLGRLVDLTSGEPGNAVTNFTEVGQRLLGLCPPWVTGEVDPSNAFGFFAAMMNYRGGRLDPVAYLGVAGVVLISAESRGLDPEFFSRIKPLDYGHFRKLHPYIMRRIDPASRRRLPELPVPDEVKQTFRDWAEGRVNFIAPA
jgi:hypothetical protein